MARIRLIDSVDGIREDVSLEDAIAAASTCESGDRQVWLDFEDFGEADVLAVSKIVALHEITKAELFTDRVREKWSDYDDYLYVCGHGLNFNAGRDLLDTITVHFLIFKNFLISFHSQPLRSVDRVMDRIREEHGGTLPTEDWVLYGFLNALTDLYMDFVDHCAEDVEKIDQMVLQDTGDAGNTVLALISEARGNLLKLRRRLIPKRDFLQVLCSRDHELISHPTQVLLRNVLDHVIRMEELADMSREVLAGAQSNYIAQVSNRMNAVMKTLSIVATIMLPLTLVAGLFGMNVHVPGQDADGDLWFWLLIGSMVAVAGGLVFFFRKMRWL